MVARILVHTAGRLQFPGRMNAQAAPALEEPAHAASDGVCVGASVKAGFVHVRGAREHNLKNVDVQIPRDALVVFTGVSARASRRWRSGRSTPRRSAATRIGVAVRPPAVPPDGRAGGRRDRRPAAGGRAAAAARLADHALVGRQRDHAVEPAAHAVFARRRLPAAAAACSTPKSFSPNTPEGACPECHGLGPHLRGDRSSMVPDDSLTIRERAIAAWPPAWHGQNLRDILITLGYDVDTPVARAAEEGSRLDPVHRRAADRAGVRGLRPGRSAPRAQAARRSRATWAPSPGAQALRAAHLRQHAERADEEARRRAT